MVEYVRFVTSHRVVVFIDVLIERERVGERERGREKHSEREKERDKKKRKRCRERKREGDREKIMERKREGVQYINMYKQSNRWIERSRERIGQMK